MSLYQDVLDIAREYMGPAAEDYVRRRIRIVQRGLPPEEFSVDRLDRLVAGIEMTAHGYMSKRKSQEFVDRIRALKSR